MGEDISILFDRIRVLLNERETGRHAESDTVELTLTDGYARALALDGAELAQLRGLLGTLSGVR